MTNGVGAWFVSSQTRREAELKLFCFPYAGGTSLIYRDWAKFIPATIQVIAAELTGRGARLKEPPYASLPPLIDDLADFILPLLDRPFAFFGHSMGALIAFELSRHLRRRHNREPELLLVSGRRAPQLPNDEPPKYNLPDDEFKEELQRINGTPKEVLEHAELMELMIPLLRADFAVTQTYEYSDDAPLNCPIVTYGGLQDEVTRDLLVPWQEQTYSSHALHMLPGGHFFIRSAQTLLLESIIRELNKVIVHARPRATKNY